MTHQFTDDLNFLNSDCYEMLSDSLIDNISPYFGSEDTTFILDKYKKSSIAEWSLTDIKLSAAIYSCTYFLDAPSAYSLPIVYTNTHTFFIAIYNFL